MLRIFNKFKKGEEELFNRLLENRVNVLYRIAYSYFHDKEVCSDIVQDVALIAYKNFNKLKDIDKFNAWIGTILVNRCREVLRKNKKIFLEEYDDKVIESDITKNSPNEYLNVEMKVDLQNIIKSLNQKYREVITLKYYGDYTIQEISSILEIPEGTVKSRLNTGIKKLRELMEVKNNAL